MRKGFFIKTLRNKGVLIVGSFFLPNSCHFFSCVSKKLRSWLRMKRNIEVKSHGFALKILPCESVKNGTIYQSYQVPDYSSGSRKRRTFADLARTIRLGGQ